MMKVLIEKFQSRNLFKTKCEKFCYKNYYIYKLFNIFIIYSL